MKTSMTQPVRVASTGEVTTLAQLAAQGRLRFTADKMETKKRAGERHIVTRYFADLIEADAPGGVSSGWEIGATAYLSRTGQAINIGRGA